MAADLILEDNRVRVDDGDLMVERNVEIAGRITKTQGVSCSQTVSANGVTANWLSSWKVSANEVDVGGGRFGEEKDDPGTVTVRDSKGNQTAHIDGEAGNLLLKGSVRNTSDARCKEDVQPMKGALATIAGLRGVTFRWRQDSCSKADPGGGRHVGLIAQEVREVLPEVVGEDDRGYLSVSYASVVPVLVEAVKEQQRTIEALRAQVQECLRALDAVRPGQSDGHREGAPELAIPGAPPAR